MDGYSTSRRPRYSDYPRRAGIPLSICGQSQFISTVSFVLPYETDERGNPGLLIDRP